MIGATVALVPQRVQNRARGFKAAPHLAHWANRTLPPKAALSPTGSTVDVVLGDVKHEIDPRILGSTLLPPPREGEG